MRLPLLRRFCLIITLTAVFFGTSSLSSPFSVTSHAQISVDYPPLPACTVGVLIFSFHFLGNDYSAITVTIDCGGGDVCSGSALICSCGSVDFESDC
jgi:hypothetical protein